MEIGDDGVKIGQVEHEPCEDSHRSSDQKSAVAFCDGDLHLGSGTEVEPLGFDQSLKLGSGHRLITEGGRFRSRRRFEATIR